LLILLKAFAGADPMTYTNAGTVQQAVQAFQKLNPDSKLMALMALYQSLRDKGFKGIGSGDVSKSAADLVHHIQEMSRENQSEFLQDALDNQQSGDQQIELDSHPTKAMLELIPGGVKPPLNQYGEMEQSDRLALWYQLASELDNRMPSLTSAAGSVSDFLAMVQQASPDELLEFMRQVI
jgi:hypothetical protein